MKIKELMRFMADLTLRTGYPVPVPYDFSYRWAKDYNFNKKGETVLYTGALYQLVPYIRSLSFYLKAIEKSDEGGYMALSIAKNLVKTDFIFKILPKPDEKLINWSSNVLKSIASILMKNKISFSYLYENDIYSGALLYDMGIQNEFIEHARKVYSIIKESNARKVVTVDPHTTNLLKNIYPRYIDNFSLDVVSYLELIDDSSIENKNYNKGVITVHDSCIYARNLSIVEKPRRLLEKAGYQINEVRRNKKFTFCCGGPIESIAPSLSDAIARDRVIELVEKSRKIVTMCPICYINLYNQASDNNAEVIDISNLLVGD
ncbi:MAG: heterodisulfide reductase-related iron-sulfur binding cluster [Caldisphaera sp.]|nr:(Fe-S)-binding protein [Caldisphaera sp.]PMP60499.1 MAG: hypothetical protein C0201_02720 [Caldisphaera sp.]PMP90514.1 MAG: hypothetical protein C0171_05020 [Caldisphaera sp.]